MTDAEQNETPGIASARTSQLLSTAASVNFDVERGVASAGDAEPVLRLPVGFFATVAQCLGEELCAGEAEAVLYETGYEWGLRVFETFENAFEGSSPKGISDMPGEVVLERWWWPFQVHGFGTWSKDFTHATDGILVLDCEDSAFHVAGEDAGFRCEALAGLFAATFTRLVGRELAAIEIECAEACRFVVTVPERIRKARELRAQGADPAALLDACKKGQA